MNQSLRRYLKCLVINSSLWDFVLLKGGFVDRLFDGAVIGYSFPAFCDTILLAWKIGEMQDPIKLFSVYYRSIGSFICEVKCLLIKPEVRWTR